MLNKITIDDKKVPFIFLFILVAAFGLLIPKLGLYWDDWPVIFMTETQGTAGFWDFYQYDRPFSAWTYIISTPVLGTSPIRWHIFSLLLRWLTVVFLWLSLRKIWQDKPRQVFWIALLFSVYPLFNQQTVAVAYSQHWISYLFYFVSVYLMFLSLEKKRLFYLLILLSIFFSLIQIFTMEYFLGLELFRPILLWAYHYNRKNDVSKLEIFKKTISLSWPYLVLIGLYAVWRLFFLNLAGSDPNDPVFLKQLLASPVQALFDLLQKASQDLIYFFSSWFVAINPTNIELRRPFFIASTGVAIFTAGLLRLALNRYQTPPNADNKNKKEWHWQAISFGISSALFGTLPVWIIGRQASLGLFGSRFGLAAMFGLSVLFVGILEWLSNRTFVKNTVICILIGVAIHFHLYTAKDFQDSWEKQQSVYWQLYWRAPNIQPGTAIISDGEIFQYVGIYSTSMGISLLYPPADNSQNMPYWFFSMGRGLFTRTEEMLAGTMLEGSLRNYSFEGESRNSLVLYLPGKNQCMKILTPNDYNDKDIPDLLQKVVLISNLDRIKKYPVQGWFPPKEIFGLEPERTWCYYFEKADLARQFGDWEEVYRLYQVAEAKGFRSLEMIEYLPLLDSLLKTNRIDDAYQLTLQVRRLSGKIDDQLCSVWVRNIEERNGPEIKSAYEKVGEKVNCFD